MMNNNNKKNNLKMSSAQESGNGTTNIVITETRNNKKVERKASMDVDKCAEAFITNFRKQLLLQRLESIENMLSRGL
ncbi:unnamed protein product [Brassica oleracea var. botrytis]|uniref:Uncharacterized protein n=2 Tax=Brassica TaxID=3705 RepID=A0A8X7TZM7_BRACI|nr:uncharacterized protein BNAC08G38910D [Brassica napus]KAG2259679.1 hypothetical protein Bca52824_078973 [Brassica carinata]VDD58817.1 unnamed protein product [Brassica oleracea]